MNVGHMTLTELQQFLLSHKCHQFNDKNTYSCVMDFSKLNEHQLNDIETLTSGFSRNNAPYAIINTQVGFDKNVFVLVAVSAEPSGVKVNALDFYKNSSYVELNVVANYCKVVVAFDEFCAQINDVAMKFRKDNMNEALIAA